MFYNCFRCCPGPSRRPDFRDSLSESVSYLYVYDAAFAVPITDCGTIVKVKA